MTDLSSRAPLKWDLFVTSGIPTVTGNPPPGEKRRFFSPISSTLIYGERDAVLVDTFMTVDQNEVLADWVKASGKNLTTVYITHGHGDHWFGIGALLDQFPGGPSSRFTGCRRHDEGAVARGIEVVVATAATGPDS